MWKDCEFGLCGIKVYRRPIGIGWLPQLETKSGLLPRGIALDFAAEIGQIHLEPSLIVRRGRCQ